MDDKVTVKGNGHWRELVSWVELPDDVKDDFDYLDDEDRYSYRFFQYRGSWYDANEFEARCVVPGYGSFQADSFFSGVALEWLDEDAADRFCLEPWAYVRVASVYV